MNLFSRILIVATWALTSLTARAETLTVVDYQGLPVPNATILIGFEPGNPISGNVLNTSNKGEAQAPADWKAALPVTVMAEGYITTTIPILMPGQHELQIAKADPTARIEIKGTTTNFGRLITDGKVDFAMVLPALNRESMLAFDISSVLSPENDTIEVIGNSAEIPSNITLPQQTETYIFPITLDKPVYRTYLREPGRYQMYALHGQFPMQRVINDLRAGKSVFEVINHFNFLESGSRIVDATGNIDKIDIAVNQTRLDSSVSVKAPSYPAGQVMISLALSERDGLFVPTDLKRVKANQAMDLKTNASLGSGGLLSILVDEPAEVVTRIGEALKLLSPFDFFIQPLGEAQPTADKNYNFNKFSFAFLPTQGTVTPEFLPMIDQPRYANNLMSVTVPTLPSGLTPAAMYAVMTEIEELGSGKVKSERRTRLWEVWSDGWLSQMELPRIGFPRNPKRKYRWEVMFLARPSSFVSSPANRVDLNTITHVTRNATDI